MKIDPLDLIDFSEMEKFCMTLSDLTDMDNSLSSDLTDMANSLTSDLTDMENSLFSVIDDADLEELLNPPASE